MEILVRNQIDFILIHKVFQKHINSIKTYPGANIGSDHNPVVLNLRIWRFIKQRGPAFGKIDTRKLKSNAFKELIRKSLEEKMGKVPDQGDTWEKIKDVIVDVQSEEIGELKRAANKKWITDEILDKMEKRHHASVKRKPYLV